jgi:hypothetical protein
MIGQYLSNNNENATVAFCQKIRHPNGAQASQLGMKTDRIRTDITDIVFVFIFMSGLGFEYG